MMKLLVLLSLVIATPAAFADDHDFFSRKGGVAPVNNDLYRANCAECHFAYQPGLLPSRSWLKMMQPKALADHFGDNAELDEADRTAILKYLIGHAAESSSYKRSVKMMRSIRDSETPLRISKVRYFISKHDEIPLRMVTGNLKVKSWSNCAACHSSADSGSYDEDAVRIPNYGRWED